MNSKYPSMFIIQIGQEQEKKFFSFLNKLQTETIPPICSIPLIFDNYWNSSCWHDGKQAFPWFWPKAALSRLEHVTSGAGSAASCVTLGKIYIRLPNLSKGNGLGVRVKVNVWKVLRTHRVNLLDGGRQNSGPLPQRFHTLIPRSCKYVPFHGRGH